MKYLKDAFLYGLRGLGVDRTITAAGTTAAQTINRMAGRVNLAAGESSKDVTNNLVNVRSIVLAVVSKADASAKLMNVTPYAGYFTIIMEAAVTAETPVSFIVIN